MDPIQNDGEGGKEVTENPLEREGHRNPTHTQARDDRSDLDPEVTKSEKKEHRKETHPRKELNESDGT
jgi:hypothetical protein